MRGLVLRTIAAIILNGLVGCGPRSDAIVVITLHPSNPTIMYIATNDYIYKSRDEGTTWEKISGGMSHSRVIALAIDPRFPATIYAGTKGDAIYKSYDGGHRWVAQKNGLDDVTVTSVVNQILFDPNDGNRLFAATTMGVFASDDGGDTWKKRMAGMTDILMVVTLAINPQRPDVMYAGTSGGVFKSTDRAKTWAKANQGLVSPELLSSSRALMVSAVHVDPGTPDLVYAATLNGLYKTTDGGSSWTRIGLGLPDQMISVMNISPRGALYVAGRQGLSRSDDQGMTWKQINVGLESSNIRSLAIAPQDAKTLYLGTNGSGLYRSHDGGETWHRIRR